MALHEVPLPAPAVDTAGRGEGGAADAPPPCRVTVTNFSPGGDNSKFKVLGFMVAEMHAGKEKDVHMAHFSWSQEKVNLGG